MRKLTASLLLFSMAIFVFSSCADDDSDTAAPTTGNNGNGQSGYVVEQESKGMVNKFTASWCPPCGSWGWDVSTLVKENESTEGKLLFIGTYGSTSTRWNNGELYSSEAQQFGSAYGLNAFPSFVANDAQVDVIAVLQGGGSDQDAADAITEEIEDFLAEDVVANVAITADLDGDDLNITTQTQFFEEAEGEYYLAVHILEDKVKEVQANQTGRVEHTNVWRASIDGEVFGMPLNEDSEIVADAELFEGDYSYNLDDAWSKNDLKVAAVIYKKDGSDYEFVNLNYIEVD